MDDGAPEPTTVGEQQQPSGKLNKTAFKLFKRRKSGGAMPSIFGVRSSKGKGDGGGAGGERAAVASPVPAPAGGLVRSKTHDGLAEVGLEGATKKEKEAEEAEVSASPPSSSPSSSAAVGKSHSFFSLLRKNGGGGAAKGERPKGRGGGGGGLKGLFNSMRWSRRETHKPVGGNGEGGDAPGLMPGSLTASLECIKEEAPPPPKQPLPPSSGEGSPKASPSLLLDSDGDKAPELDDTWELMPALLSPLGEDLPGMLAQVKKGSGLESPPPLSGQQEKPQEEEEEKAASAAITGCGDIIADHEGDTGGGGSGGGGVSGGGGGSEKSVPGASKKPVSVGGVLTYQGGGEEMASPEQVGDTCAPEFWDVLSQTSRGKESPKASKEVNGAKGVQDGSASGQHVSFNHSHKEDQKSRDKEQQEAIPSGDEGYWDSTTPGPEEDTTNNIQKEVIPRDSYSGDALYDLYTEPEENTATTTSAEDIAAGTCGKPLSPVTTTCPVKTHTTSLKDSKIPISIKHFTSPHSSHGPDTSNSHHIAHHHPTKSEIPRTKIPVSKVLVQRAGYRSLAGTTGKAATYHESAKK